MRRGPGSRRCCRPDPPAAAPSVMLARVKCLLSNDWDQPLRVRLEPGDQQLTLEPGDCVVLALLWTGFADLTCGDDSLEFRLPEGGCTRAWTRNGDELALALGPAGPGSLPVPDVQDLWIHNGTGQQLTTQWELLAFRGIIPPGRGPIRAEWTEAEGGDRLEFCYEPAFLVVHDWTGGFRAWEPDGTEIPTMGTRMPDPDDPHRFDPRSVPGWPVPPAPASQHQDPPDRP
jgi:hypothetical protein